ncbi:MAG: hypothetical protein ACK55Z_15095, partial [bacterium]
FRGRQSQQMQTASTNDILQATGSSEEILLGKGFSCCHSKSSRSSSFDMAASMEEWKVNPSIR